MRYKEGFITEDTGGKRQTHYNIRTRVNKNGKRKKRIRKQKPEKTEKEKNGRQTCKLAKLAALPHPHTCAYINNATK